VAGLHSITFATDAVLAVAPGKVRCAVGVLRLLLQPGGIRIYTARDFEKACLAVAASDRCSDTGLIAGVDRVLAALDRSGGPAGFSRAVRRFSNSNPFVVHRALSYVDDAQTVSRRGFLGLSVRRRKRHRGNRGELSVWLGKRSSRDSMDGAEPDAFDLLDSGGNSLPFMLFLRSQGIPKTVWPTRLTKRGRCNGERTHCRFHWTLRVLPPPSLLIGEKPGVRPDAQ